MTTDNDRYIVTAFDASDGLCLVWSNAGKGFPKEKALYLYKVYTQDKYLINITVSKIVTVTEQKIYTFDNE